MWLFTRRGFLSIVMQDDEDPANDNPVFAVRARNVEHLANFFPDDRLIETKDADYAWRVYIDYRELIDLIREIIDEIDYTNFKDACRDDEPYHGLLDQVWSRAFMYQLEHEDYGRPGVDSDAVAVVERRLSRGKPAWYAGEGDSGGSHMHQHGASDSVQPATRTRLSLHGGRGALDTDGGQQGRDDRPVLPWYRRIFRRRNAV